MVLLLGSDSGSITKGRAERLSTASSTTLTLSTPPERVSKGNFTIHLLHAFLVIVCAFLFVSSLEGWDAAIHVDADSAVQITSYITLALQAIFTAVVLLLYETTRQIAIDHAIRHQRSLNPLNSTIRAWSGISGNVKNWVRRTQGPIFRSANLSIYLGIPLYLITGSILQLSISGLIGVNVAYYDIETSVEDLVASHSGGYGIISANDITMSSTTTSIDLWEVSRQEMFLSKDNDTQRPGIQANLLYDIPSHSYSYDLVQVNATQFNVACSQPSDALVQLILLPQGENIAYPTGAIRSDASYKLNGPNTDQIWVNISMPRPPYWDSDTPGLSFDFEWANNSEGLGKHDLKTMIVMQPWVFSGDGAVGSDQLVFAVASGNPSSLITDPSGSTGSITDFTITLTEEYHMGQDDDDDDDDEDGSTEIDGYVQVIGCTLSSASIDLTLTEYGIISQNSNSSSPHPHPWTNFTWEEPGNNDIDRQFLIAFTQDLVAAQILQQALGSTATLQNLEKVLERLFASYIWNTWQKCSLPSSIYQECGPSSSQADHSPTNVTIVTSSERAHLQIIRWRAAISFCASIVLASLVMGLLGWRTDRTKGQNPKDLDLARMIMLMQESSLPVVAGEGGSFDIPIRYQATSDGKFENLDYWNGEKIAS